MVKRMAYTEEDFEMDAEWLAGYGVEKPEAFLHSTIKKSGGKVTR